MMSWLRFGLLAAVFCGIAIARPAVSYSIDEDAPPATKAASEAEPAPAQDVTSEPASESESGAAPESGGEVFDGEPVDDEGLDEDGAPEGDNEDGSAFRRFWPPGAWVLRDGVLVTRLPDRDWDSRLELWATWIRDPRLWGFRVAEAADESYLAGFSISPQPIDVGAETQLLGRRGTLDRIHRTWHAGLRFEDEAASLAFGYKDHEFASPSGGAARGFRGVASMREAYLETRITIFRFALNRSLNGGDVGGTLSSLGAYLPIGNVLVYGGANYNHRYFRRASGVSHYDLLVALWTPSLDLDELRNVPQGGGRYAFLPYGAWQFAADDAFEDNVTFGLQLRFEY